MKATFSPQISVMSSCYCHYSFDYFLNSMNCLNIKNIEIWGGWPHICYDDLSFTQIQSKKNKINRLGINIVAYTPEQVQYPYNIAIEEPELRKRSIDYFKKNIEIAKELGAPIMIVSSGWGYLDEQKNMALERSCDSLRKLSDYAQDNGITLALEVLTKISSNIVNYSYELAKMVSQVNSPALKGMLDVGQMSILGETVRDYFAALGESPVYIHIMDGQPAGHLALGDGVLPVKDYIDEAYALGYSGYFSMEINDRRYFLDPDKAIGQSLGKIKEWYGEPE